MKIGNIFLSLLVAIAFSTAATKTTRGDGCVEIKDGTLLASDGSVIQTGYDQFGYNYQAHKFNGTYDSVDRTLDGAYYGNVVDYADDKLTMKWNEAWLSNKDCDGDGQLDYHLGHDSYIGSGAWLTNQVNGDYHDAEGNECHYTYFVKVVAVSANDTLVNGIWHDESGVAIGPDIWGQFAIVQSIYNDPCGGAHGVSYLTPSRPGFGNREDK